MHDQLLIGIGIVIGLGVAFGGMYGWLVWGDRRRAREARRRERLNEAIRSDDVAALTDLAASLNRPGERPTYTDERSDLF
jgi:hypothetical protein